jgi:hypothetical protein
MNMESERPAGMAGRATIIAVLIVALMLATIVVRKTVASVFARSRPEAALRFVPGNSDALLAMAAERVLDNGGRIDADVLELARAVLLRAPLAAEPLIYQSLARGDAMLAKATLRRDPRSRAARRILVERAARTGRYSEALAHLDRLIFLEPQAQDKLLAAMAAIASDPASRAPLVALVDTKPAWRIEFLKLLNHGRADPALIFRLTNGPAGDVPAPDKLDEQGALLTALVAKGDYERAYLAWINFLPGTALADVAAVYDGGFRRLAGPPPFNWLLTSNENGSAEFSGARGLRVDFFGSSPATFATQVLLLQPGAYRLRVEASGSGNSAAGTLYWTVTCITGGDPIAKVSLAGLGDRPSVRGAAFTVPAADCKAQRLALSGEPAEFPAPINATTTDVSMNPVR